MSKEKIIEYIDQHKKELIEVSMEIFNNPELNFKEFKASKLLAKKLEDADFKVKLGVADLETAIYAEHPEVSKGPNVAILAEYDALPEIGHACGHNLIAAAALGASLALGSIKKELLGKLVFMGTPAEEGGGGKIFMIEKGLFQGIDAVMMFHPSSNYTLVGRGGLALTEIKIEFFGQTAHASADPENGINALDAVIQTFNGISALRQHIPQTSRIHGRPSVLGCSVMPGQIETNFDDEEDELTFYVTPGVKGKVIGSIDFINEDEIIHSTKFESKVVDPNYARVVAFYGILASFAPKILGLLGLNLGLEQTFDTLWGVSSGVFGSMTLAGLIALAGIVPVIILSLVVRWKLKPSEGKLKFNLTNFRLKDLKVKKTEA